jgi:hypothetical protein
VTVELEIKKRTMEKQVEVLECGVEIIVPQIARLCKPFFQAYLTNTARPKGIPKLVGKRLPNHFAKHISNLERVRG